MCKLRFTPLLFAILFNATVVAAPQSIDRVVGNSDISEEGENKIQAYAEGWSEELGSSDFEQMEFAYKKLIAPFAPEAHMTPYARSLYGKYLKSGLSNLLSRTNKNEAAAVDALQVIGLLGTEQGCGILLNHADSGTEPRSALRLWATVGLGSSFLTGELAPNRIERYARLLSNYVNKERAWYVLARQFDSLAALQSVPKIDRAQQDDMVALSFELQTDSLNKLLTSITSTNKFDERVQSLTFILPSLRIQLIEPSVDEAVKKDTLNALVPSLITFVEYAVQNAPKEGSSKNVYRNAAGTAGFLIDRALGNENNIGANIQQNWNDADMGVIVDIIETWKSNL